MDIRAVISSAGIAFIATGGPYYRAISFVRDYIDANLVNFPVTN